MTAVSRGNNEGMLPRTGSGVLALWQRPGKWHCAMWNGWVQE